MLNIFFGGDAMQLSSPVMVKDALCSTISSLLDHREKFLINPNSDFTRTKKISFEKTIIFPMVAASDNVPAELMDFFEEDELPSPSAIIQRRAQVKPEAYKELFYAFTAHASQIRTFRSFRLIAFDGSRLNLPYNPSDPDTFIQCIKDRKGINQLHFNCLYDILNDLFLDVELQSIHAMNEKAAFTRFLDDPVDVGHKAIFIADRGSASYNIFAHAIHHDRLFLIRVPALFAKNICPDKTHWLDQDVEDQAVTVHIGRCRTRQNRQLENYHYIPSSGHYDYIEAGSKETEMLHLRVVKFPLSEGSFEYIVTNLPKDFFSTNTIRELYRLRWCVETAYRHLKYAGNMVHIHSFRQDFLVQEIYGKLTMYNFSSFIAACTAKKAEKKTDRYLYVINHTLLQKICIRFLRGKLQDITELICRSVVPVRPGRRFERNLRRQSADPVTYR